MSCPFVLIICTVSSGAEMRFAKSSFIFDKIWAQLIDYMYIHACVCRCTCMSVTVEAIGWLHMSFVFLYILFFKTPSLTKSGAWLDWLASNVQEFPLPRSHVFTSPAKWFYLLDLHFCFTYGVIFPAIFHLALKQKYEVPSSVVVHSLRRFYTTFFFSCLLNFKDFQLSLEYVSF